MKKKLNVLVYNKKGSSTKTTIAIILAYYFKMDFYTNDVGNSTIEIYSSISKDKNQEFKELGADEEISIDLEKSNVFDFGGFLDKRIWEVARFVDWCVVPISYQSVAELTPTILSIKTLAKYNSNIVIVINNTEKDYVDEVKAILSKQFKYPIFVINQSKYFKRLANENKNILQLWEIKGLRRIVLKNLITQVKDFFSFLEK